MTAGTMGRACSMSTMEATRPPGEAMGRAISAVVVSLLVLGVPAVGAAEWAVKPADGAGCVLESTPEALSDGYQPTTARIRVDKKTVTVLSPSVLDAGFKDIGIVVDEQEMVPMDRLGDPRSAMFESRYAALVDQFKRGARARIQLRFWPTWPETGTHSAMLSLMGFTRAYARLEECK